MLFYILHMASAAFKFVLFLITEFAIVGFGRFSILFFSAQSAAEG